MLTSPCGKARLAGAALTVTALAVADLYLMGQDAGRRASMAVSPSPKSFHQESRREAEHEEADVSNSASRTGRPFVKSESASDYKLSPSELWANPEMDRWAWIGEVRFDRERLVYAQVPKTGSTTLGNMIRSLADGNNVHWNVGPGYRGMVGDTNKQFKFVSKSHLPWFKEGVSARKPQLDGPETPGRLYRGLGFTGHVRFLDFRRFRRDNPVWISQVRDPVERFVSWFYFNRRRDDNFKAVAAKSGLEAAIKWQNASVADCVRERWRECDPKPNATQFEPSPITYFCGYSSSCAFHGSPSALNRAKSNVERFFKVVGVLEHFHETLQLMEHEMPNFLGGITNMNVLHRNSSPRPHDIPEDVRARLRDTFRLEHDLYEFVRKRFFDQYWNTFGVEIGHERP